MDGDNVASLQKARNWLYHNIRVIDICIFDNFSDFSRIFNTIMFLRTFYTACLIFRVAL